MSINITYILLDSATLEGENPLPRFRDPIQNRRLFHDGTLTKKEEFMLGSFTGEKVLPYKMQDSYSRELSKQEFKTITLENDLLKATFFPDCGARLYSLVDKTTGRDILFKNEALILGNLGQRDAWFSGGIEFNFGHYGHSAQSLSPLYAGEVQCEDETFLRFYEFERVTGGFYQMDFHLPNGSKTLDVYVRLINVFKEDIPTYWWTNVALPETADCRVFCGTKRAIVALPRRADAPRHAPHFGAYDMPFLPVFDGDASYPNKIDFSCEYFFQYGHSKPETNPWEAVGYEDGRMFFETSTEILKTRKMFCWGNHQGGNRWQEWLNRPIDARYVELQAGITPTQLHGLMLPAKGTIEFTQSFGESVLHPKNLNSDWEEACVNAEKVVRKIMPQDELNARHKKYAGYADAKITDMLHMGSGWGSLEVIRLEKMGVEIPKGLNFPPSQIDEEQLPWLNLLNEGIFKLPETEEIKGYRKDISWQTGKAWRLLLEKSLNKHKNWESLLHYGVMCMEEGEEEKARLSWSKSVKLNPHPITYRNLAQYYKRRKKYDMELNAVTFVHDLNMKASGTLDFAYYEESLESMFRTNKPEHVWNFGHPFPDKTNGMHVILCLTAEELGFDTFLLKMLESHEFHGIRENDNTLTDLWFKYMAKKQNISEEVAKKILVPPKNIDFRMHPSF